MKRALTIRESQQISLEILKRVATVCEELQLRYYLIYGTLIGAIRHQGFIPWDDDLDIMMPRPDYDALLQYMQEHGERFEGLEVFNHDVNSAYPYMITRISDRRYRIVMENEAEYGMGVFIDIYPYDGLGNTREEALEYGLKGDRLSSLCYQATRQHFAIETTTSQFRKVIKLPIFLFSKLCGKDMFQNRLEKLARLKPYDESEYVGCVVWLSGGEKDIFRKEWFEEVIEVPFEGHLFKTAKEYDKILRHVYGDYMQLPPEKDRVGHHNYKVFER